MWESKQVILQSLSGASETSGYSNLDTLLLNQPVCLGLSLSEWKETFFLQRDVGGKSKISESSA